ncbi:uncharacterized protein BKA55DRAFT_564213 [Fusarium redolens]|uniref:CCHC-type domain-containing protein n=1 Tax=Fusarium redolens TaxID=48865 RepID=A0A9P9KAM8_FUSRE|nr:uncharacterized protein BKA55DRAFT_564213 [Fusarium redolens]KAH7255492.1 hypothetical protein BKA55DRAFT_564213 [Fusarium redolens]
MSRDCTEPMKDNKSCYKCGQPGHISRDCPMSGGSGQATECYKVSFFLLQTTAPD